MSLELSARCQAISPSPTLSIDTKTKAMVASGIDVINLSVGEPDFKTPDAAALAGIAAIVGNFTKYTAVGGIIELRRAISEKLRRENALEYDPEEIVVSTGAKQSLYNIFTAILNPGDEVLLPAPYWVSYPEQIRLCGGVPVPLPTDESTEFKITPNQVERAITPRTKAILINSPSNPTGATYTPHEIRALAEVLERRPLFIISDEIYEQLTYDVEHYSVARYSGQLRERTFVVNGFSKTFAMTGWRIGYVAAPKPFASAMASFQSHTTANASSVSQRAALGAFGAFDRTATMSVYRQRRDFVLAGLNELSGVTCVKPEGAFYAFPNVSNLFGLSFEKAGENIKIDSADTLCELLLTEAHVSLVPGTGFGAPANVRLSYAASLEQLQTAMARIADFMARLS